MRILMTADTVGGVWTYALELARSLVGDAEIALATMGAPLSSAQRDEVRQLRHVSVYESHYQLEWMNSPWDDVSRAGYWLLELEQKFSPDVVHLNGYAHGSLPWNAPVVIAGHSCVCSWWQAVKGEDVPARYDRYCAEVRRGLQAAAIVITPSKAMLDVLEHYYGRLARSRVIANGRSPSVHSAAGKQPFVLSAGRLWDEAKNIVALAEAAPRLEWEVFIAGDSGHPDGYHTEFENVHCLGKLSSVELAAWMSRASIFVLPARYEPFGLSAVEAALSGCALVLGDIPSQREVWGNAALFVPPEDSVALARTINRLIHNQALRTMMAARARTRARLYTPERMAGQYLNVYQQLIAARQGSPECEYAFSTIP
jgi:glycosyltransferase involved in cell wall biosynthesis